MQVIGPNFGYYLKPSKTWLVVKPEYLERAKEQFHGINIPQQGLPEQFGNLHYIDITIITKK